MPSGEAGPLRNDALYYRSEEGFAQTVSVQALPYQPDRALSSLFSTSR
jgi:hypothetical protein